ncbi:MAG: arginyl-tRNA synthetase [Myxococcota bacterium]|jgi:arginyl-tRNA synthetase
MSMEMYRRIEGIVQDTLNACVERGDLQQASVPESAHVEKPRDASHGDFASTICLRLAKPERKSPRDIARAFLTHLVDKDGILESADMAGAGFINFTVRREVWLEAFREIGRAGDRYGRTNLGAGKKVLVEFVSANPTGPLHVGHGRGAVTGDAVAELLSWAGYDVDREYYINDVGNQMNILGNSLLYRYKLACGVAIEEPKDLYKGDYVNGYAEQFRAEHGDQYANASLEDHKDLFIGFIKDLILVDMKRDLGRLGIHFDRWYSERTLHDGGHLHDAINALRLAGHVRTDEEGRTWFESSKFGDEDDRVVVRDNGVPTYFAADIAYHRDKFQRGYDLCIDVWGSDHHGYIPRVKASLQAMGLDPDRLEILLYQFVNLVEGGKQVKMTTRGGVFERLDDLLDDVGEDATRVNFVMRKSDAQFDFDLALAKENTLDNPVFYVQYGHARICQILAKAAEKGYSVPARDAAVDLDPLVVDEELALCKRALDFPWVVSSAAQTRAPHHVVHYIQELSGLFHSHFTKNKNTARMLTDNEADRNARLVMCLGVKTVLKNALRLLGVDAPDRMDFAA